MMCSFELKMHQIHFRRRLCLGPTGEITTFPQTIYSAGEGDALPDTPPLDDAFGVSILQWRLRRLEQCLDFQL